MSVLNVSIKHGGKSYPIELDTSKPPIAFKASIFEATGVPPERMKVMVKGGVLKDDGDWHRIGPKAGQTFMVIGAAGELPKPPEKPVIFLEDLADQDLAEALKMPAGFKNLGNTCYMNATLQTMRAIPELQDALSTYRPTADVARGPGRLAAALRDTYANMDRNSDGFVPNAFLGILRELVPQFAERNRAGGLAGYAQQDAEECWTRIVEFLSVLPASSENPTSKFVEQYMMGEIRKELRCIEAPDEPPTVTVDRFKTLGCNITSATNFMQQGITDAMTETIEKQSPSLNRSAQYEQKARITRLPANLVVHMVRFAWKRDINKKAKIMRKVKFPFELDATEWCADELKGKMRKVTEKSQEIERERRERAKIRKRTKSALGTGEKKDDGDVQMTEAAAEVAAAAPIETTSAGGDLLPEYEYRTQERKTLDELVHPDLKADIGASVSGLYELAGIVTHKGASADSGHYIGFARRDAFMGKERARLDSLIAGSSTEQTFEEDEEWYKFDDDRVSVIPKEKILTLEGGGEDSVAYILLYRSKKF